MTKIHTAINRLQGSLGRYDALKSEHADLTKDLAEAKKEVDEAARLVVGLQNGSVLELPLDGDELETE